MSSLLTSSDPRSCLVGRTLEQPQHLMVWKALEAACMGKGSHYLCHGFWRELGYLINLQTTFPDQLLPKSFMRSPSRSLWTKNEKILMPCVFFYGSKCARLKVDLILVHAGHLHTKISFSENPHSLKKPISSPPLPPIPLSFAFTQEYASHSG